MVRCDLRIRVRRSPCADWMDGVTATRGKHEAQTFTVLHQRHLKRAENSNAAYIPYHELEQEPKLTVRKVVCCPKGRRQTP